MYIKYVIFYILFYNTCVKYDIPIMYPDRAVFSISMQQFSIRTDKAAADNT